ncbi:carbon-nitrogen hydrolase family protein [Chelativorans xinjiangense]|uniref:carbon-nitrogen hydrolase family protein n=1 Tax=Chelativorans xinjiangense TaxID=2681485 RepID=UPI001356E8EF|nr:carbon-nitrogen hydrolase family protein [Chelativorans xinjiangense]
MKLSLIQMNSQPDRAYNLQQADRLMRAVVERDAPDMIVLPEHFDWSGGTAAQKRAAADDMPGGAAYRQMQAFAAKHRIWIHAGSLLERIPGEERIHNTAVVFDPEGTEVGRYRKIHMFDIEAPDGKTYRESEAVKRGSDLLVYEAHGLRIGAAICYDLRFSRLFDRLASKDVDLIILPAAFTLQTGKDHWEVLCRARAIEFQAYFAACGQWGRFPGPEGDERQVYGHSLVCDPWGHVVARASDGIGFVTCHIDPEQVSRVRKLIPMSSHRVDLSSFPLRFADEGRRWP